MEPDERAGACRRLPSRSSSSPSWRPCCSGTSLPLWLPVAYLLLSGISFTMYRADKSAAAVSGRRRTPESTLHTIDLLGGWPGALVARHVFRHKTVKQPFRTVFWLTVVVNCAALAWLVREPVVRLDPPALFPTEFSETGTRPAMSRTLP